MSSYRSDEASSQFGTPVESQSEYLGTGSRMNRDTTKYSEGIAAAKKRARSAVLKALMADLHSAIDGTMDSSYSSEPQTPMSAVYVRAKAFCEEYEEQNP